MNIAAIAFGALATFLTIDASRSADLPVWLEVTLACIAAFPSLILLIEEIVKLIQSTIEWVKKLKRGESTEESKKKIQDAVNDILEDAKNILDASSKENDDKDDSESEDKKDD